MVMEEVRGTTTAVWYRNTKVLNTLMIGVIVALGVLYIGQVNASASKALALRALEEQKDDVALENTRLNAKIAELRSLDSVLQRQQFLGLVKVENISYISGGPSSVALR